MASPTPHDGREFFAGLLDAFTGVLGLARGYLRLHGPSTGHLSRQIALQMGHGEDVVARLIFGAVLADVGMIGMAEDAWEVPSPVLDPRTRARVRRHPVRSHAILSSVPHLENLGYVVRHHHEWWNGTGYPDGLSGEAIPLESRILRLADTVSALQTPRPHRGPLAQEDIVYAVERAKGEEFDPQVADAYLALVESGSIAPFDERAFRQWTHRAAATLLPDSVSPLSAEELLEILAAVVDAKDPYTAGHSRRVALLSDAVAEQLALSEDLRASLRAAGFLHDIGKLGIPLRILTKPGRLTDEEFDTVRGHAGLGADVLASVPSLSHLAPAARYHHERWDGSGYPEGLSGEQIPLLARILAVADAYDAMTTSRAYRGSRGHLVAMEEITHEAGRQFAPEVARAFVTIPDPFFQALREPDKRGAEPFRDPAHRPAGSSRARR